MKITLNCKRNIGDIVFITDDLSVTKAKITDIKPVSYINEEFRYSVTYLGNKKCPTRFLNYPEKYIFDTKKDATKYNIKYLKKQIIHLESQKKDTLNNLDRRISRYKKHIASLSSIS